MYLTECISNNLKILICILIMIVQYQLIGKCLYIPVIFHTHLTLSIPFNPSLKKWQKTLSWCKIMKYYASCVSLHVPDCTNKGLQEVGEFFCEKIGSIYFVYLHVNESKKWESDNFLYLYASACLDSRKYFFTFIYYFILKEELFLKLAGDEKTKQIQVCWCLDSAIKKRVAQLTSTPCLHYLSFENLCFGSIWNL